MTAAIDFDRLARLHMPSDPAALRAECRRLLAAGLKPRDVSIALRLDLGQVLEALADPTSPPPPATATSSSLGHSATDGVGRSSVNFKKGAFK